MARTTSEAPDAASPATKTFGAKSGNCGRRKPMASRTMSAFITSGLPTGSITGRPPPGLGFHAISCTSAPVTLPSRPRKRNVLMHHRRVQPSSWLDVVLSVRGHWGQGCCGSSGPSTGRGIISTCVTLRQPWRCAVPMQSLPVSPPPMTSTSFPLAFTRSPRGISAPASTRFCWASMSRAK